MSSTNCALGQTLPEADYYSSRSKTMDASAASTASAAQDSSFVCNPQVLRPLVESQFLTCRELGRLLLRTSKQITSTMAYTNNNNTTNHLTNNAETSTTKTTTPPLTTSSLTIMTDEDLVWKPICIQYWDTAETVEVYAQMTGLSYRELICTLAFDNHNNDSAYDSDDDEDAPYYPPLRYTPSDYDILVEVRKADDTGKLLFYETLAGRDYPEFFRTGSLTLEPTTGSANVAPLDWANRPDAQALCHYLHSCHNGGAAAAANTASAAVPATNNYDEGTVMSLRPHAERGEEMFLLQLCPKVFVIRKEKGNKETRVVVQLNRPRREKSSFFLYDLIFRQGKLQFDIGHRCRKYALRQPWAKDLRQSPLMMKIGYPVNMDLEFSFAYGLHIDHHHGHHDEADGSNDSRASSCSSCADQDSTNGDSSNGNNLPQYENDFVCLTSLTFAASFEPHVADHWQIFHEFNVDGTRLQFAHFLEAIMDGSSGGGDNHDGMTSNTEAATRSNHYRRRRGIIQHRT